MGQNGEGAERKRRWRDGIGGQHTLRRVKSRSAAPRPIRLPEVQNGVTGKAADFHGHVLNPGHHCVSDENRIFDRQPKRRQRMQNRDLNHIARTKEPPLFVCVPFVRVQNQLLPGQPVAERGRLDACHRDHIPEGIERLVESRAVRGFHFRKFFQHIVRHDDLKTIH